LLKDEGDLMNAFLAMLFVPLLSGTINTGGTGAAGPSGVTADLDSLISEAMLRNPEILSAIHSMGMAAARVSQASSLDDPEFLYTREDMRGFNWSEPFSHKFEVMQMVRFPTKLGRQSDIASIQSEHAHHDHLEKVNEVLFRLKSTYAELWFAQQALHLNRESIDLVRRFSELARTKYGVGSAGQQDVLKSLVELARIENERWGFLTMEQGAKAMLMSILDRTPGDSITVAVLPDSMPSLLPLDSLQRMALRNRPMLLHDSLSITEKQLMLSLARQEYLPDIRMGVEYMNVPAAGFDAWTVKAGITLPFAPWTLGKASARVDEAEAGVSRSEAEYRASVNMVVAAVRDLFFKAQSLRHTYGTYQTSILPAARQSLESATIAYQTGETDFLMLIDAYRTLVDLEMERAMLRMKIAQTMADLDRAVGVDTPGGRE
jgi:outer membrane protein TolC